MVLVREELAASSVEVDRGLARGELCGNACEEGRASSEEGEACCAGVAAPSSSASRSAARRAPPNSTSPREGSSASMRRIMRSSTPRHTASASEESGAAHGVPAAAARAAAAIVGSRARPSGSSPVSNRACRSRKALADASAVSCEHSCGVTALGTHSTASPRSTSSPGLPSEAGLSRTSCQRASTDGAAAALIAIVAALRGRVCGFLRSDTYVIHQSSP